MYHYVFIGAVAIHGNVVMDNWEAHTVASSEARAISNLKYRFRKQFNYVRNIPVSLIGDITTKI